MHVDAAVEGVQRVALEGVHDLVARQHAARGARQHYQQVELVRREVARLAGQPRLAGGQINDQTTKLELVLGRGLGRRAAQQSLEPGQQLARLERLGQVVVGADLQADDAVHGFAARREHQQRQAARAGFGAQLAREVQPVAVGQHQVQQQRVVAAVAQQVAPGLERACTVHLEAVAAQVVAHHGGQAGVIVDQQQV